MQQLRTPVSLSLAMALALAGTSAESQNRPPQTTAAVQMAPTPVRGLDGVQLVYELRVLNIDRRPVRLTRVDVLDGDGNVLQTQEDSALLRNLGRGLTVRDVAERARIDGGMWAIVWLWVTVPDAAAVPDVLRHRLTLQYDDASGTSRTTAIETGTTVPGPEAIVIGPPLRGGYWWAGNLSNNAGHRRAQEADGTISQRFAIDYARVDDFGRNSSIDLFDNKNHYDFGADVLAVANGVVVAAADSMSENHVGRQPPRSWPATGGNYVQIHLGQRLFATYMHLQSGSVRVRAGDTVTQGQVIGRVGNTGASVAPHLHFQLDATPWPAGRVKQGGSAEGVPYVHPSYELVGPSGVPHCRCEGVTCAATFPQERTREMPMLDNVIHFPGGRDAEPAGEMSAARRNALCKAAEGRLLIEERRVAEAIIALEEVRSLDATLDMPGELLARVCWAGSLSGQVARVLDACDRAVTSEPGIGDMKRGRGLARALSGDLEGAARDFEAYLGWLSNAPPLALWQTRLDGLTWGESFEVHRSHVESWLQALRSGKSPFTDELLDKLRGGPGD